MCDVSEGIRASEEEEEERTAIEIRPSKVMSTHLYVDNEEPRSSSILLLTLVALVVSVC